MKTMKRFLSRGATAIAATVALSLAVSGPAAADLYEEAKKEGNLTIYTDQPVERIQILIDKFEEKYPGIDVDFHRSDSTSLLQRFETESAAGRHTADVMTSVDRLARVMVNKGLVEPYASSELGNYPQDLHAENNNFSIYGVSLTSFAWNTDLVSESNAPKTWEDLLDPKWKGKIGMQDPLSGGGAKMWVVTMYRELGEEKWLQFMEQLVEQQPLYGSYLPIRQKLISGEIEIQVAAYPDFTEPEKAKGAPVDWGSPRFIGYVGLTVFLSKNARHPNAGKLFIDFMLSEDGQEIIAQNKLIPAMADKRPGAYARTSGSRVVPNAVETLAGREEFFDQKMQELFGKR